MFDKLANIFRIPDLRKRILFTLGCCSSTAWVGTSPHPESMTQAGAVLHTGAPAVRCSDLWICFPAASCAA